MSIKSELWNRVLDFTSKKQPVFAGVYQASSSCMLTCSGTCSGNCTGNCTGGCNNTCTFDCKSGSGNSGGW